jgi:hypothetical protein
MRSAVIEIEGERVRVAVAEGKRGFGFGRVGEAVKLGELHGAVDVFDVAEDAAGADGRELLIITDQSDTRRAVDSDRTAASRDRAPPSRLRR